MLPLVRTTCPVRIVFHFTKLFRSESLRELLMLFWYPVRRCISGKRQFFGNNKFTYLMMMRRWQHSHTFSGIFPKTYRKRTPDTHCGSIGARHDLMQPWCKWNSKERSKVVLCKHPEHRSAIVIDQLDKVLLWQKVDCARQTRHMAVRVMCVKRMKTYLIPRAKNE